MTDRLRGKVALITGGAGGIGTAMATLFLTEGARVLLADLDESRVKAAMGPLASSEAVRAVRCDVTDSAQVARAVQATVAAFGKLDILCNNAGVEGKPALTVDYPEEEFSRVLAINLTGTFYGMKHALPAMRQNNGGAIINMASIAGLVGVRGSIAYNASKAAVVQVTKTVALEYAKRNIRVNAIAPGFVDTPMMERVGQAGKITREVAEQLAPIGRLAAPREIALAALYLASDESVYVTGTVLTVDGGYTAGK